MLHTKVAGPGDSSRWLFGDVLWGSPQMHTFPYIQMCAATNGDSRKVATDRKANNNSFKRNCARDHEYAWII